MTSDHPYRDSSLDVERRVDDLLLRMTLEDKAGVLFQPMATLGDFDTPGLFGSPSVRDLLEKRINHANILGAPTARGLAEWTNRVQAEARSTGLGIPFTFSSDPRHSFGNNPGTAMMAGPFSQWPEMLGFGALDDPDLVRRFADTVRREYLAVGLRLALHPQIDLASEPRWARASATFGQDAAVAGRLGAAYVRGLQTESLGPQSVSAMAKHFPGGGPQKDGEDPHFAYGREQVYPGGQFQLHLQPFREIIAAGVSQLMPYYGMPMGIGVEEVGFSFNRAIVTDLLRDQLGFQGVVCTDWAILSTTFWGVEDLSYGERMQKALDAGVDQFGGEFQPEVLVGLVRSGKVEEGRLDASVRRLLREKFTLGLFDDPFVDAARAEELVGAPVARTEGQAAQAAAMTLLRNVEGAAHLPLPRKIKVYAEGLDVAALAGCADVVARPEDADVALLRLVAPWEQRGRPGSIEFFMHAGPLDFGEEQVAQVRAITEKVPTVIDVYLDRPAILTPLQELRASLVVNFGATDEVFARVGFGEAEPRGRLPFQIPSSMAAVVAGRPDVPGDSLDPAFEFGAGLRYQDWTLAAPPTDQDRAGTTVTRATRFDFSSVTLGELMNDPAAGPLLAAAVPNLEQLPMLDMLRHLPFATVLDMLAGDVPTDRVAGLKASLQDT